MIRVIIVVSSIILIAGCSQSPEKNKQSGAAPFKGLSRSIQAVKLRLIDSLKRFSGLSSCSLIEDSAKYKLDIATNDGKKVGLIGITDSMLYVFRHSGDEWIQDDSASFETYQFDFSFEYLNDDDQEDLIVYGFGNMHGQSEPFVFLCDSSGRFRYRPDIKQYNPSYNQHTKLFRSFYEGGAFSIIDKEIYHWVGDSLKLIRGAAFDPSAAATQFPVTTFYVEKNGKRFDYKTVTDKTGKIYDTAVWKDN
ncbi:MAG TPA: hypothetical protein VKH37_07195 [Ferruginibacter sp.]|nr:hypothetical protein [Ferruginibacter sp.]